MHNYQLPVHYQLQLRNIILDRRKMFIESFPTPSERHKHIYKEFGTFRLGMNRRAGHTTFARELLMVIPNSVLFLLFEIKVKEFLKDYPQIERDRVCVGAQTKDKVAPLANGKTIIVDTCSFYSHKSLENFYDMDPEYCIFLE